MTVKTMFVLNVSFSTSCRKFLGLVVWVKYLIYPRLYLLESMYHFKFFIDLLGKLHFFADIIVNVYISKASLCENEAFCQVKFW